MSKRISIRIRDPNPLFRTWLSEWANQADNNDQGYLGTSLRRALRSLEKYPLPIKTGRDCMILDGFGVNFCDMIDKKLAKYQKNPVVSSYNFTVTDQRIKQNKENLTQSQSQNPPASPKPSTSSTGRRRIRKTKSDQALPKTLSHNLLPISPPRPGAKRKATIPIETVLAEEDVIMVPDSFETILLVDSMETVG